MTRYKMTAIYSSDYLEATYELKDLMDFTEAIGVHIGRALLCGKPTIARSLFNLCERAGHTADWNELNYKDKETGELRAYASADGWLRVTIEGNGGARPDYSGKPIGRYSPKFGV